MGGQQVPVCGWWGIQDAAVDKDPLWPAGPALSRNRPQ